MKGFWMAAAVALCAPSVALAGACDVHVKKAATAKGDELVTAYNDLTKCDKAQAASSFEAFMKSSGDADTLVGLSLVAIDAEQYTPVWSMIEKIPDYSARDEVAEKVGAACADHAKVLPFLQGAYFGLRDIQFEQWDDALVSCPSDDLTKFLEGEVGKPPSSSYNEKYAAVVTAYVKRKHVDALPALEKAAIASAASGPFDMLLEKMASAAQPAEIGEDMSAEDKKKLEDSLVKVANGVEPGKAKQVADSLYNAGAEAAAASLLPRVYPDRVQAGGKLLYGVASVEVCEKEAVVHWAGVTDPAKRWSILGDVEAPARAFKPKLKCGAKDWPVLATPEPVKSAAEIQAWVDGVVKEYADKSMTASAKGEKDFALN